MPQYDWLLTDNFKIEIRARLEKRLAESKITGYPYITAEALADIAKENRPELENRYIRSMAAAKNMDDALNSLDQIIKTAIDNAQSQKRTAVTFDDIEASIKFNFCKVWPFCK